MSKPKVVRYDIGMTVDLGGMYVLHSDYIIVEAENKRLRQARDTVRFKLSFLLADVERCGSFEDLTEVELPRLHDILVKASKGKP